MPSILSQTVFIIYFRASNIYYLTLRQLFTKYIYTFNLD